KVAVISDPAVAFLSGSPRRRPLTPPAPLSPRERGEKVIFFSWSCSPPSPRERGARGVRASEGRSPINPQALGGGGEARKPRKRDNVDCKFSLRSFMGR